MTPVGALCLGLLLYLLDLRLSGVDVLADPVGWVYAVVGLSRLTGLDARFQAVRTLAVLAGLLSLADVVHPTAGTSAGAADPAGPQGALLVGYEAVALLVTVLLCLRLRDRAAEHGEQPLARRFSRLALLLALVGAAALLAGVAVLLGAPREPSSGLVQATVVLTVLAAVAVAVWLVLTLARCRHRPWLQDVDRDPVGGTSPPG